MAAILAVGATSTKPSQAEKPQGSAVATDWQKGKKFAPKQGETRRLCAGTSVQIAANSELEVMQRVPLPMAIEGLGSFAYAAQLTSGRVDIDVDLKQRPANGVFIYGPRHTSILARGGHVSVVADKGSIAVAARDGKEVSVAIGATWKHINPGSIILISPESPQGSESKLPVAPTHLAVNRPVLAIEGSSDATRATWDAVTGANHYRLSLTDSKTKAQKDVDVDVASLALGGLAPGRYDLRVAAIGPMGIAGESSSPASANVVGLELPPGAFLSQGKAYLQALQQLTLTNVEGLEATYDNAPVYFKAPNRAGLRGKQATTLHLRMPGASDRVSLEIVPRALHTEVQISPAMARWPRDKVVVRVILAKQAEVGPSLELVPSVTVNNQVVRLDWTRTDQGMETVIPTPPNYPGPWVLRAEVADQHGVLLGRNFLEIASTAGVDEDDIPREIHRGAIQVRAQR
ncbi:MAG TPA: hypothetical protein VIV60_23890 [Polyangiaceae bacterium]